MGWKIIEIEEASNINLFLENIIITKNESKIKIPINDIDVLLINNFKLKITIQLLNALSIRNVLVIICDNQYLPCSNVVPIIGNYNTLKIIEKQIMWSDEFKGLLWRKIIKNKIKNQYHFLLSLNKDLEELIVLHNDVKDHDISNREGHASKIYWHNLFGLNFKRHNDDYINSLLNYGYTILRSYFTRSIIKKGLDPRIALFHKSFHNYFALASDLMEPFRVIIDIVVYKIVKEFEELKFYEAKQLIIKAFNNKILINEKLQYINNAIDIFIDSIINESLLEISIDYSIFGIELDEFV